jgi:signal transduction histidine kinase
MSGEIGGPVSACAGAAGNILVADDTLENLRLLVSMLSAAGHEVRPVTSGQQALVAAERDPPDLILLDINMPDLNGFEVCARLAASPAVKDIPVIFLTALSDIADKVRAFEVGGVDYITKPFQVEEVHARVRTHLALRRTRVELSRNLQKLQALERLRDDLVHMLVHDMRSPLMALTVQIGLVREEAGDALNERAREDLREAALAAESIARMANDLIDVSRLEHDKLPLDRRDNDIAALVEAAVGAISHLDVQRSIEVDVPPLLALACDGGLVRRVLDNMVSNAIKHTPRGGRVSVRARGSHAGVRVTVADEGLGVPPEARESIFEKFGAVVTRSNQQYHSVGLGLAFCRLAVQAHGGTIGVDSNEPRGSVFWFELPH